MLVVLGDVLLTNRQPMEVGLEYGWDYWKQKLFTNKMINEYGLDDNNQSKNSLDLDN